MSHRATPRFWACYRQLPSQARILANDCYRLLQRDPKHPSLHFKRVGRFWSIRIGIHFRALAVEVENSFVWFWIGSHPEYDRLIRSG